MDEGAKLELAGNIPALAWSDNLKIPSFSKSYVNNCLYLGRGDKEWAGNMTDASPGSEFRLLLLAALKRGHIKQKDLAGQLDKSPSTISFWLSGRQKPAVAEKETIEKLASILDLSPSHLRRLLDDDSGTVKVATKADFDQHLGWLIHERFETMPTLLDAGSAIQYVRSQGVELEDGDVPAFQSWLRERLLQTRKELDNKAAPIHTVSDAVRAFHSVAVRDRFRRNIRDLNAAFATQGSIPRNEFVATLGHGLSAPLQRMLEASLRGESPLSGRLPQPFVDHHAATDRISARWQLSPDFVMGLLGGFSSGIRGLDMLLDGGFLPQVGGGPLVLLRGRHGRGKSTLALELAAALANQSQLIVYLATEERAAAVLERLSFIGYHAVEHGGNFIGVEYDDKRFDAHDQRRDKRAFRVTTSNDIPVAEIHSILPRDEKHIGLLCIATIPPKMADISTRSDRIAQRISELQLLYPERYLTVFVDSLDAITETTRREELEQLFGNQRHSQRMTVFVCKEEGEDRVRDYLADIVIKLDVRQRAEDQTERTVELTKGRTQSHRRGAHAFTIGPEEGVTVYPSIPTYLGIRKQRIRDAAADAVRSWRVNDDLDLDRLLDGNLRQGSSALLYGKPDSLNTPLALSFLAAGRQLGESGLFVSFQEDEGRIRRVASTFRSSLGNLFDDAPAAVKILHQGPGFLFPERILHWLRDETDRTQYDRIVVSGLTTFMAESPSVSQEALLVPALHEMLLKAGTTVLFAESRHRLRGGLDLSELFDVVLHSSRADDDTVTLRIERGAAAINKPHVVSVENSNGGARLLLR